MKNKSLNIIDKLFFKKSIVFYWKLLNRNIIFWILFSLFVFSSIISSLVLILLNKNNMLNYLLLNNLISLTFSLIFIFYCVSKLFLESKYSSVDLIMRSKPYKRTNIYLSRFTLILFFVFISNSIQFILISILTLSFGLEANWVLYNFVSFVFINTFISTFFISLFILFSMFFKKCFLLLFLHLPYYYQYFL